MVNRDTQDKKSVITGKATATEPKKSKREILVKVVAISKPIESSKTSSIIKTSKKTVSKAKITKSVSTVQEEPTEKKSVAKPKKPAKPVSATKEKPTEKKAVVKSEKATKLVSVTKEKPIEKEIVVKPKNITKSVAATKEKSAKKETIAKPKKAAKATESKTKSAKAAKDTISVTGGDKSKRKPDSVASPGARSDALKGYMDNIIQYSLVTRQEEVELAAQIHGDDPVAYETARETLINANLRLVVKIAHDFKGIGLPLTDLISEGNIGLMRAVEKFDPAKGAKFSSYAAWWIKQSMRRALANQSRTIRIPVQSASKINKIRSARMMLTEKLGREPNDAEIASHLDFSQRTVAGLRMAAPQTISLHDPIQQGEDGEFQDIVPDRRAVMPDQIIADIESRQRLRVLMHELDDRERRILQMRFGLGNTTPKTLEDVSQEIGRTRERVRQIQNQALLKLKAWLIDEADYAAD